MPPLPRRSMIWYFPSVRPVRSGMESIIGRVARRSNEGWRLGGGDWRRARGGVVWEIIVCPPPAAADSRTGHLDTLYEISKTITSSLDLDEVLNLVMDKVIEVTGAQRGFLMLKDA